MNELKQKPLPQSTVTECGLYDEFVLREISKGASSTRLQQDQDATDCDLTFEQY